jgi:hypothetical protein
LRSLPENFLEHCGAPSAGAKQAIESHEKFHILHRVKADRLFVRGQDAFQHIGEIMCVQALIHHLNLHLLLDGKLDREQKVILQIRLTVPTSLGGGSVFQEKRQTTDSFGSWVLVSHEN